MKKIFTLLFTVMAAVSAMAGTSFNVKNPMTIYDNTQESIIVENQSVWVIQNDDETWSLKFEDLGSKNFFIGDITFDGINVTDKGYYVYHIQCNEAKGKVTDTKSPYYDKTLILQLDGDLSPKGYGNQAFTFEIYCNEDEDCYFQGSFSPDEGVVDGIIVPVYYVGKSQKGTNKGDASLSIINDEESGTVTFAIDGLKSVDNGTEYGAFYLPGLEMMNGEEDGVYIVKAADATATTEDGSEIKVKSLEVKLVSNAGPDVMDDDMGVGGDDDMGVGGGDDDMGVGDDDMGVGGDELSEWTISGTLVILDPTTGDEYTYELSSEESTETAINSVKTGANGAAEYFSLNGARLNGAVKGITLVRKDGKTVKCLVK